MANFLKLIRFRNLIFIAYIQFVIRQVVLLPVMQVYGFEYSQGVSLFWLLVAGTVLIAAGGYALNDYFDIKIDALNHPETQIVGKDLTRRAAMGVYVATTLTGIIFGLIVAVLCKSFTLAFIFVIIPGLLWFYSSSYKRQFLTGNIIVSFSSALTILTVVIFQVSLLENKFGKLIYETPIPSSFYLISGCFALFAFLTTCYHYIYQRNITSLRLCAGKRKFLRHLENFITCRSFCWKHKKNFAGTRSKFQIF